MLPEHATQWADEILRDQCRGATGVSDHDVDHLLTVELQNGGFFIADDTLGAIEISKGGMPLDKHSISQTINLKSLLILDQVVAQGDVFNEGFNLEQVAEAERLTSDARVTSYGARIREVHAKANSIRQICNDDPVAGSIFRLLAIRPSGRVKCVHDELKTQANEELPYAPLSKIRSKIDALFSEKSEHIASFLRQLPYGVEGAQTPVALSPMLAEEEPSKGSRTVSLLLFAVVGAVVLFSIWFDTKTKSKKPPVRYRVTNPDPMASYRAVEKYSAIAALRAYVEREETLPKLLDAMVVLKNGVFEEDDADFQKARDYMMEAYVDDSRIDAHEALRNEAQAILKSGKTKQETVEALYPAYAKWWSTVPAISNPRRANSAREVLELQKRLLKKRAGELKDTNEILKKIFELKKD